MLEFAEVTFDDIAFLIEHRIDCALDFAIPLCGNVSVSTTLADQIHNGLSIVTAVSHKGLGRFETVDQCLDSCLVRCLAGRKGNPQRQSILIDQSIDLGAQSSTRPADGVIRTPFFPPAACWWARMIELSIRCIALGEADDKVLNTRTQTPALAQRLNRL